MTDWGLYPSPPELSERRQREEEDRKNEAFDEMRNAIYRAIEMTNPKNSINVAAVIAGLIDDGRIPHVRIDY